MADKMRVGWLWFDNDPSRSVEEKVRRAAEQYREKFGQVPDTCYVHPRAINEEELQCGPVRVICARHILLNHFWLGITSSQRDMMQARPAA